LFVLFVIFLRCIGGLPWLHENCPGSRTTNILAFHCL
jgi:hypothetical protein